MAGQLERNGMARKPNYKFERLERERAKAAKKAAKLEAKREKAEERKADAADTVAGDGGQGTGERD
jgi:hypothetical protein